MSSPVIGPAFDGTDPSTWPDMCPAERPHPLTREPQFCKRLEHADGDHTWETA